MTDILLTTLNARYSHASLGLRYLLANMGKLEERTSLLEFTIKQRPIDIAEQLLAQDPRIIGLGVYIWNARECEELVAILKQVRPEVVVVLGGPEVSYEQAGQSVITLADYVISGQGELAFARLCERLLAGELPPAKLITPEPYPLEALQLPYRHYSDHDLQHRVVYVEASRGCPFKCEFCLSALDKTATPFDLDLFLAEMEALYRRGLRRFKFVDRTFNLKVEQSIRIMEFFLARLSRPPSTAESDPQAQAERTHSNRLDVALATPAPPSTPCAPPEQRLESLATNGDGKGGLELSDDLFLHFELIPDRLPEPLKAVIQRFPPGSLQFEIGVQSFNPEVQALISRQQDNARTEANLRWLRNESHAHLHVDLIIGLPGEDRASFAAGFDRLVALNPHEVQVGILKRLRGAPIARHSETFAMRFQPTPPYNVLSTDRIDFAEMQRLARFARYWDLIANAGRFTATLPLILGTDPFARFLTLSDWLYAQIGQTHQIQLPRLFSLLHQALTGPLGIDPAEAETALSTDFDSSGLKGAPSFAIRQPKKPHGRAQTARPKRQDRHHTAQE